MKDTYDPLAEDLKRMHAASEDTAAREERLKNRASILELLKCGRKPKDILGRARIEEKKALAFFQRNGVEFSNIPTIAYQGIEHPSGTSTFASAKVEDDFTQNLYRLYGPQVYPRLFGEHYGLKISPAAVNELIKVFITEVESEKKRLTADITLYANTTEHIVDLPEAIAHELWHIKERDSGLIDPALLIYEGTASYAGAKYIGRRIRDAKLNTLQDYIYIKMGYIVQEHMEGKRLAEMLSSDLRQKLKEAYNSYIAPYIVDMMIRATDDPKTDSTRLMAREDDSFKAFRKKQDAEGLMKSFRARGLIITAQEIEGQDLSRLFGYHKKLIADT